MVVRSVNIRSVVRVAFALSLSLWGIGLVGLIALFLLGLVSGGLGGVEGFIASLGFTGFKLSILPFIGAFLAFAGLGSAAAAALAGVGAALYNLLTPLVGGVELKETALPPPKAQEPRVASPGGAYPSP